MDAIPEDALAGKIRGSLGAGSPGSDKFNS